MDIPNVVDRTKRGAAGAGVACGACSARARQWAGCGLRRVEGAEAGREVGFPKIGALVAADVAANVREARLAVRFPISSCSGRIEPRRPACER